MTNEKRTAHVADTSAPLDFERILRLPQKNLKRALADELRRRGYAPVSWDGFLYAPGTAPVLLTAHMDTVHPTPVEHICYTADRTIAMSPEGIGGDDRAGIYMVLKVIEEANCHVLFCEDEEIGCVGARKFTRSEIQPEVNYVVEMDRRGSNDAVFYDCDNREFTAFVCGFGFEEAQGSCSDISHIAPYLGVAAVNISAGYYNEHRLHEHINLPQMERNAQRVGQMVQAPAKWFAYIPQKRNRLWGAGQYEEYSLWDFMGHSERDTRTLMMPLPQDACIQVCGQQVDCAGQFYIDKKNNVYEFLPELDAAILSEATKAVSGKGAALRYDGSKAQRIQMLPLEEAMERLLAG